VLLDPNTLNATAFTFRTEFVMSEATNAGAQSSPETMTPETPQRGDVLERGLLIGAHQLRRADVGDLRMSTPVEVIEAIPVSLAS
jgi:hypothetical protein